MRLRMPFGRQRKEFPSHLWTQCPTCGEMLFNKQLARNNMVCTKCEHHFRLGARERIELLADKGSFTEHDVDLVSGDPLGFSDQKPYPLRIAQSQTKSGEKDAAICGTARIDENEVELAVMDFEFMGGSMGSVVGEKLTRAGERALTNRTQRHPPARSARRPLACAASPHEREDLEEPHRRHGEDDEEGPRHVRPRRLEPRVTHDDVLKHDELLRGTISARTRHFCRSRPEISGIVRDAPGHQGAFARFAARPEGVGPRARVLERGPLRKAPPPRARRLDEGVGPRRRMSRGPPLP